MSTIGSSDFSSVMLGSTEVTKVYLGTDIVYQKVEPTVVDTDGNVYRVRNYVDIQTGVKEINLGIYPMFPSDGFEAKIKFAGNNRQYVFGGGYSNSNYNLLGIQTVGGLLRTRYNNSTLSSGYDVRNKTLVVKAAPNFDSNLFEVYIDGTRYNTNALVTRTPGSIRNFYIGRFYNMTDYGAVSGNRIYYFKYWRNDVLVRDMIPVIDENDVYALFDQVNLQVYYSTGSSDFTGG